MSLRASVLRCFYWLIVSLVLLVSGSALLARFWLLPQIERWREPIAHYASQAIDAQVEIGAISGRWRGWRPRFDFSDIEIRDPAHASEAPALHVPRLVAELQWRSFLVGEPRFSYLSARGVDLTATWTQEGHLRVAGQSIDLAQAQTPAQLGDSPVLQWLRRQGEVTFEDATLHWRNEQRDAPVLSFNQVALALRNTPTRHQFSLTATPQDSLSGKITVTADLDAALFRTGEGSDTQEHGTLYAEIDRLQPERLTPWVNVDEWSGTVSARGWAELAGGKIGDIRTDVQARDLSWRSSDGQWVQGHGVRATFEGAAGNVLPAAWMLPAGRANPSDGLTGDVTVQGLTIALPEWFEGEPWRAAQASGRATLVRQAQGGFEATLREARVHSDDVTASLEGRWTNTPDAPLGNLDLDVTFEQARISAIYKYLPRTIDDSVRRWLALALVQGDVRQGRLEVAGPLEAFPFDGARASAGKFTVQGQIVDATLDYLPEWRSAGHRAAWPRIEGLNGRFAIDRTALTIQADTGRARLPQHPASIGVGPVLAHIPDMTHDARLLLDGQTEGDVASYLELVKGSALNALSGGAFQTLTGRGAMHMPLVLNVPLARASQLALRGELGFDRATLRAGDQLPEVREVAGRIIFTRDVVRAIGMKGQWLGGPVAADGTIGSASDQLVLAGRANVQAIRAWDQEKSAVLQRFDGQFGYRASIARDGEADVNVDVTSDLVGLAMRLPAPFAKDARTPMPLRAAWRATGSRARTGAFDLTLGPTTRVRLEQGARNDAKGPRIARAAVAINRTLVLPETGLRVDAQLDRADTLPWRDLVSELDSPTDNTVQQRDPCAGARAASRTARCSTADARPMIGPERDLRLQVGHLLIGRFMLDDLDLQAQKTGLARGLLSGWTATLSSRQAQGRVDWRNTANNDAGKVVARLSRLSLEPSDAPESERDAAAREVADRAAVDMSGIPAIDLAVDQLSVYRRPLGALSLQGTNLNQGEQWRLDALHLRHPDADVNMTGMWTARGERRGLAGVAQLNVRNLGQMLTRLGKPGIVSGGEGNIDARITWRDSPWTHRFQDIDGDVDVNLRRGRLLQVESSTARLLELFSLQSLSRIVTLKADPTGPARGGFPFDEVKSHLRLDSGILRIDDYAIDSPIARIKLVGETDVGKRTWDVRATVIPKLDASGAALVAGLVVNPVVGVSALVAQWLLRAPLEAALIQRFRLSGSWEDPVIETISAPNEKGTATQRRNALTVEP